MQSMKKLYMKLILLITKILVMGMKLDRKKLKGILKNGLILRFQKSF